MLTTDEARMLQRLVLREGYAGVSAGPGVRLARARGFSPEFQDYRRYQPGDDPRSIDWTVEARLRQLVVRVCRAEGRLCLNLLIDVSGSMAVGTPSKLACATKLAAALCYAAVERRDSVGVATFGDTIRIHLAPEAGRRQVFRVFGVLREAVAGGRSCIDGALKNLATATRGRGLAVVVSDFFQPDAVDDGLRYLRYCGLTPVVLQVVAAEELRPVIADEVELVDIEDPLATGVRVDGAAVDAYRRRVSRASAELEASCVEQGVPYARIESSATFAELVHACIRTGLLAGAS